MPSAAEEAEAEAVVGQRRLGRPLIDAFVVLFLATIGSTFHRVSATVLILDLARRGGGEEAAAKWTTAVLVASALSSAIAIPAYSVRASRWGHRTLLGLALVSAGLYEVVWYSVASTSQAAEVSSGKLASALILSSMVAGLLGGDQLVSFVAVMLTLDLSPDEHRAQNLNLVQAIDLLGNLLGPLMTSLLVSRQDHRGGSEVIAVYFLFGAAWYFLALIYLLVCFRKLPRSSARIEGEGSSPSLPQSSKLKPQTFKEVLCFQPPPEAARLRPLPIPKILASAIFASEGASVMSYLQLSVDNQFGWSARENSFLLAFISGARFVAIFVFVPLFFSLAGTKKRGQPDQINSDHHHQQGETAPLLPASEEASNVALPRQDPKLRVARWSYFLSAIGWLLIAYSAMAHSAVTVFIGSAVLALGIGANPAIHAYATHMLKSVEQLGASNEGHQQEEEQNHSTIDTPSSHKKQRTPLELYLGLLYFAQNAISVLSPLLDGLFYTASLHYCGGNASLLFLWAALQYSACAGLVMSL